MVTIPSCVYLIQSNPKIAHGHEHGEGGHDEHQGEEKDEEESRDSQESESSQAEDEPKSGKQAPDNDSKENGESEGTSDDASASSGSDDPPRPDHSVLDAGQGTPDTSREEHGRAGAQEVDGGNNVEGVRFKGATSGGTEEGVQGDTRKIMPDAKGGVKHRIESHYGKQQGLIDGEDGEVSLPHCLVTGKNTKGVKGCGFQNGSRSSQFTGFETAWTLGHVNQTFYGCYQRSCQEQERRRVCRDSQGERNGGSRTATGTLLICPYQTFLDQHDWQAENRPGKSDATDSENDS